MEKPAGPPPEATATEPIPTGPGALPVLGHVLSMLRDPLGLLASLPASGDLVQLRIGPFARTTVVCDPELTRQMLRADDIFDKGGPIFDRAREVTGNGLANCPHAQHRRQRGLMQPAFHRDRFPGYAQAMAEEISGVIGEWRDGQPVDVQSETMRLMVRVGMRTMFSAGLDPRLSAQATEDLTTVLRGIFLRTILPETVNRLPTPGNRRYQTARDRLRRAMDVIIAERRADPEDHGDLLYALLTARDPDSGDGMTDEEIVDQVVTVFAASAETSASTSAWALYEVARDPALAEQLRAEVDATLGDEPPGLRHLPRLPLAGRIITETLRLHPPAWILTRMTTRDTELGGHRIPAGTTIAYSAYLLHHQDSLFDDPERFDPGRWDSRHATAPRGAFVPFGSGARKCIGDQFGITMATLTLATVTAHWRLEPLPGHEPKPRASITLRPAGLRMRAVAR